MKLLLVFVFLLSISFNLFSHSGRLDYQGGHNCSSKSINKGLCTGYHYHNNQKVKLIPEIGIQPQDLNKLYNSSASIVIDTNKSNNDSLKS